MDEENLLDKLLEEQNGYIRLIDAQNVGLVVSEFIEICTGMVKITDGRK